MNRYKTGGVGSIHAPNTQKRNRRARNEEICGLVMGFFPVLGRILFSFIPIILALIMAFYKMKTPVSFEGAKFVWFDNFKEVLIDANFGKSMLNTLIYSISLPISIFLALLLASALNSNIKGKGVFRVILLLPFICSTVAVVFIWKWLYNTNYGVLNVILNKKIGWLDSPWMFRISVIIMSVWDSTGYKMLLLTASLTAVNLSYYEAAEIDGATAFHKFVYITIPAISPTTFFLLITGLVSALQMFSQSQILDPTGGQSISYAGLTVVFYLYRQGFNYNAMGMASAAAFILSAIILLLTVLNFKLSKLWVHYD